MKPWLPWVLFGLTLGRHNAVDWLARLYPDPSFSRKALFYAAGGIVGASLYAIVWHLTPWRPAGVRVAVALVCCWSIMEESATTVCRIGLGLDQPAPALHPWQGICDSLMRIPISTMMLVLPVIIAYALVHNKWGRYDKT